MADPRWDRLRPQEQIDLQLRKLRHFLRYQVLPFHPHYREVFETEGIAPEDIQSLTDLGRIPFSRIFAHLGDIASIYRQIGG